MGSDLKSLIRIKKQLKVKQSVLYRKSTQPKKQTRLQLILPTEHGKRAIEGCHDKAGHLGKDRKLELPRDRIYWPSMETEVLSYINSSPRCLRRKAQQDLLP